MPATDNSTFNGVCENVAKKLELSGIVPLIQLDDVKDALPVMGALTAANISVAEIIFRTPPAKEILKLISTKCPNMLVGAGTIISLDFLHDAVGAGAKYIVTPSFNTAVIDECIRIGIPVFPTCSSSTELEMAYERGLRVVKFFPAELLGGVEMLKALSGPYPMMRFMPTGGINADNLNSYLSFPKVLCAAGTYIVDQAMVKAKKFNEVTRIANESINKMLDIKLDHVAIHSDKQTGSELLKTFARLTGQLFDDASDRVAGIEVVRENHAGNVGHIAFSTPNPERCLYYLERRGFSMDASTMVRENGRLLKFHLAGDNAGFTIQVIKK